MSHQNSEIDIVVVNIMGREFKLKCPKEKTAELRQAANYLNYKMQEIQKGDTTVALDRLAITAALNITYELIVEKQHYQSNNKNFNAWQVRCSKLKHKLSQALANSS